MYRRVMNDDKLDFSISDVGQSMSESETQLDEANLTTVKHNHR